MRASALARQTDQPARSDGPPQSPRPRRMRPPSWLDLRLVIGVLLVLASVLVGAKLIGDSDRSTAVWSVSRDLAAGTVLNADDLVEARVRLYDNADLYLAATANPAGKMLNRPLQSGELLPTTALGSADSVVALPLSVPSERVPRDLTRGGVVDVYASSEAPGRPPETALVLSAATVLQVDGRGDGALSVDGQRLQVLLSVPGCLAAQVIAATEGRTLSLAVLTASPAERGSADCADAGGSPDQPPAGDGAPSTAPAPGSGQSSPSAPGGGASVPSPGAD